MFVMHGNNKRERDNYQSIFRMINNKIIFISRVTVKSSYHIKSQNKAKLKKKSFRKIPNAKIKEAKYFFVNRILHENNSIEKVFADIAIVVDV